MQGPFYLSDPVAESREFAFFLVDINDLATPETVEAGGQPQIRKPGETSWTNTNNTLVHIGEGHYIVTLDVDEINVVGLFGIRYKSANTAEFQDIGIVTATNSELLNSMETTIRDVQARLRTVEAIVQELAKEVEKTVFESPL